jgi:hypothetical protein
LRFQEALVVGVHIQVIPLVLLVLLVKEILVAQP